LKYSKCQCSIRSTTPSSEMKSVALISLIRGLRALGHL